MSSPTIASVQGLRPLVFGTAMAQFLLPFMVAGVNPITPAIGADLNASAMELGIFGAVYALSLSIFHLLMGRISDIVGKRRIFLLGVAIFTITTGFLPMMPTPAMFSALRFIQAIGAAMMNTSSLSMLMILSPAEIRGQVIGTSTIGIFLGITSGPTIGGLIADTLGWQWLFYLLVPLGVIIWVMLFMWVPNVSSKNVDSRFDILGAVLWFIGMGLFAVGATWILSGIWAWIVFAAGVIALLIFTVSQYRADVRGIPPILDVKMALHNSEFLVGSFVSFIQHVTIIGPVFLYALYLQFNFGMTMLQTGLMLGIQPGIQLLFTRRAGQLADEHGALNIYSIGLCLTTLALCSACTFGADTPLFQVPITLFLNGVGLTLFGAPNNTAIMSSVDSEHLSQASGMIGTLRTTGMLVSMVIASVLLNIFLGDEAVSTSNLKEFLSSMRMSIILYTLMNAVALFVSLRLKMRSKRIASN